MSKADAGNVSHFMLVSQSLKAYVKTQIMATTPEPKCRCIFNALGTSWGPTDSSVHIILRTAHGEEE